MTEQDAIRIIETAKAEAEWNCPLDYQEAFNTAIAALKKQAKQELQKYEKRLPEGLTLVLTDTNFSTCAKESWLTFQATGDINALDKVYRDNHDSEGRLQCCRYMI